MSENVRNLESTRQHPAGRRFTSKFAYLAVALLAVMVWSNSAGRHLEAEAKNVDIVH